MKCVICHQDFEDMERVVYSTRETFVWKPAHEVDTVNAAEVTPIELAESRKAHQRTAVVNTFILWGKAVVPDAAFSFRHVWCEPQRTGASGSLHPVGKHAIRFGRAAHGRMNG